MAVMGEARSTPTYPSVAPPRYGGCVSAFLHFFDWTPAKRFSSTKRLSANKPEKAFRRSRSFRGDHGAAGKTRMMCQSGGDAVLGEVPDGTRAPGVVARLMGLESLPQPQALQRDDRQGTPILLQDLLKRDYKGARRATLRERIPAIFPRRAAQEESKRRRKKSASLLTAFRCRPDVSPAYIDIPATSRFLSSVARSPQSPFVSRLPPRGELHESPSPASNFNHLDIPELSLRASSTGTTGVVLQGWPLESQHIVPPDIFHEDYESTSVGSRPTDSASSKPLMAVGSHKVVHGRRRGSSWNGSEGSDSTIEQDRKPASEPSVSSSRHRTSRRHEPAFKTTRRPASSKSPKVGKRGADSLMENSRASSQESMSGASLGSVSSKTPTGLPGKSRASNPGHRAAVVRCKGDDELHLRSRSPSRSKEIMAPGKPPPKVKNQKGAPSQSGDGVMTRPKVGVPSYGVRMFGGRKEGDKVKMGSPALVQHLPTLQRFSEKAAGAGKQTAKVVQVQDLGERLKTGNVNGEEMATQSGVDDTEDSTTLRFKRKSKVHNKHARAPSVDDVFPELPFEFENCKEKCDGAMERVLLGQGLSSSPDQISSSPLVDYSSGVCMLGRLSDALVDYDELPCLGEYGKEAGGLSGSPLIECEELRSLGGSGPPASSAEEQSIPSEVCQAQEAGGGDDLRWEDERVLLSGRCCERSCSGPSISSESLPSDVEDERNGDSWSSCASNNNLGDCHSPRPFEITEIDVEPESLNQEHQNSPPTQFVKKILDPTGLDLLVDEAGQPSPVSILNSPFHDEPCTASESSVTDSILRQPDCEEIVDELDALAPSCSASNVSNSDKIRQALLDISMFWSREEPSCTFEPPLPAGDTKGEQSFIRGVLSAAQFLSTPGSSPDWHAKDVAIDPSLFDKLESGDMVEFSCQAAGGLWRCDRKLLFDCVNEAFGLTHLWHCQGGGHEVNWLQEELVVCRSSRPRGELLVVQVGKQIDEWRQLASYAIDSLIERDMSVHFGNWQRFGREAAEVGLEIEDTVWEDMLEEVVADMNIVSTSKQY